MKWIRQNITLVLGLSIPFLMMCAVMGILYLPSLFVKPHYNFLYVTGNDYYYELSQYAVIKGKLVKGDLTRTDDGYNPRPHLPATLYIYDVASDTSKEVSFEEVQTLNLKYSMESPDGFTVVDGNIDYGGPFGFFLGSGKRDYNYYLIHEGVRKKINMQLSGGDAYPNYIFLGWIL